MKVRAIALAALGVFLVGGSASSAENPTCAKQEATIVGSAEADVLRGTDGRDVVFAGGGNDLVLGLDGPDIVCGGAGDDVLDGGDVSDRIYGGPGDDLLLGDTGSDTLSGGPGDDEIRAARGNDVVGGGGGTDLLRGGFGDDRMQGGTGDRDDVGGDLGIDIVNGGPGDSDLVHGDYGWDYMSGGAGGGDIASFATAIRSDREGGGVMVSLSQALAIGDGRDRVRSFEAVEGSAFGDLLLGDRQATRFDGGPGDDEIRAGRGDDEIDGGSGSDRCRGASRGRRASCGRERTIRAGAYVQLNRSLPSGSGLTVIAARGNDEIEVGFDPDRAEFTVRAATGIAILGPGCRRPGAELNEVVCTAGAPGRWLTIDLGAGDDSFRALGGLEAIPSVRVTGAAGNDLMVGGAEDGLFEGGPGANRLFGGAGGDGLIGGLGGPDVLEGGEGGDLVAAGGACVGGRMVGGPGDDNASFAETPAHPGLLFASLPKGVAYVRANPRCRPIKIDHSFEGLEGSFGADLLIGDRRPNGMLGQPGPDRIYGGGGGDVIDARDGERDVVVQCGAPGSPEGLALGDPEDPAPRSCKKVRRGEHPIPAFQ